MRFSFLETLGGAFNKRGRKGGTARKNGRRPSLFVEELESRLLLSAIGGVEVVERVDYPNFTTDRVLYSNDQIVTGIQSLLPAAKNTLIATATNKIQDGIRKHLGSDYRAYNVNIDLPTLLNRMNSELDATIKPDNSVQLDFIIRGLSGSLSVAVPGNVKIGIGVLAGLATGGPLGAIIGSGQSDNVPDPTFSFTASVDITIPLADPNQGFGNAPNDPNYFALAQGEQSQVIDVQVTPTNSTANLASRFFSIPTSYPPDPLPNYVTQLISQSNVFAGVSKNLTQAAADGAYYVLVTIDRNNGMLEFIADKQFILPTGMYWDGANLNIIGGGQIVLDQDANGWIQATLNGTTVTLPPNGISTIDVEPGSGQNSVKIQGVPAGITVNVIGGHQTRFGIVGSNDTITVGSSLPRVAGTVNINYSLPLASASLTVDDSADTVGQTATITQSSVMFQGVNFSGSVSSPGTAGREAAVRAALTTVNYTGSVTSLKVLGGSGNDRFNVTSTAAATPVTVDGGAGSNTVFIGKWVGFMSSRNSLANIAGPINVVQSNISGQTSLTIDDSGESRNMILTSSSVSFAGLPAITYRGLSSLALVGGTGSIMDVESVAPSTPVTIYNTQNEVLTGPAAWQVNSNLNLPPWDPSIDWSWWRRLTAS